ncbi:MAG: hypothetical protein EBQ89_06170, partial [Alphaproteobacteria bacterium]|nr:hypothetical protein [Alphaproteobacteria bacterium]
MAYLRVNVSMRAQPQPGVMMKKTFFLVLVLCIAFLSSPVWADARQEADQAFATWREALSSNKPDNVVNLYAPDAVLLATLANKPITNHHDRMAY